MARMYLPANMDLLCSRRSVFLQYSRFLSEIICQMPCHRTCDSSSVENSSSGQYSVSFMCQLRHRRGLLELHHVLSVTHLKKGEKTEVSCMRLNKSRSRCLLVLQDSVGAVSLVCMFPSSINGMSVHSLSSSGRVTNQVLLLNPCPCVSSQLIRASVFTCFHRMSFCTSADLHWLAPMKTLTVVQYVRTCSFVCV